MRRCIARAWVSTVTRAAKALGINRVARLRVLHGKAGISVDLALRLEAWLDGPSAESWLKDQLAYDLWQAEQRSCAKVVIRHGNREQI
ncbi:HigA family addiction module antitoxin [uncultured Nitrosomonas sp.]|uniref:HigA family addiction module antitoxin n=1 Tax=uncultured Nitrosomonas sp. TaxID=156424 RepID=UPI002622EA66|nr:HigA family addiction module antitoxin [uncultured Nitrosomonas sp.]